MRLKRIAELCLLSGIVVLAGCETFGVSEEVRNAVIDTNGRIRKLDKGLDNSIKQLIQTTAELSARLETSNSETTRLTGLVEDNQLKLTDLTNELGEFKATVYRDLLNRTVAGGYAPPAETAMTEGEVGRITIEQPSLPAAPVPGPPQAGGTRPAVSPAPPASSARPASPATYGDPKVQYQLAQRSYANDDWEGALQQFTDYLARNPESELSSNAQFWKGKCLLNLGHYDESIEQFIKVATDYPNSSKVPFALHNQAVAHSRLGQTEKAIELMQEVIENYPISPAADQAKLDLKELQQQ